MSQDMTQHHFSPETQQKVITNPGECISNELAVLDDASQLENDKQLIKSHPLFVLLELLFDKCERATRGEEVPSSTAYDSEIQEFVRQHESTLNPIFIDDVEIDNLMVKAIQVLRIHLLELEKVNELCKDFCTRYISCLKGKMHSENLLRSEVDSFPESNMQHHLLQSNNTQCMANTPNSNVTVNHQGEIVPQGGVYPHSSPSADQPMQGENGIDGSTLLSQVGVMSPPRQISNFIPTHQQQLYHMNNQGVPASDEGGRKTTKRGVLPKVATEILRSWLFSHIVHPYPTEDEKKSLAGQTNLTLLQVNNWFINARRRILQPMLDASNHETGSSAPKHKKGKVYVNRPVERFWSNTVTSSASGNSQMTENDQLDPSLTINDAPESAAPHLQPPSECFRDAPVSQLDPRHADDLHRYRHPDAAASSRGTGTLNMVKN